MHNSAFPLSFHVISIIPRQSPRAFLTALDELSGLLETAHPGAHYHTHYVDIQDHATSKLIRKEAGLLRTNLPKLVRKTTLPLTSIILIAHGSAISVLREALAAVTSNDCAEDESLPHHIRGVIFHDSATDNQRNEHIEVYLPDEPEKRSCALGATKLKRDRYHGSTTSRDLPFARDERFQPRMCFRLDQSETGRPMHSHHCPVKRGSQNAFMLALDIIFSCSISSRAPNAAQQSALSPFDQTKDSALSPSVTSCGPSARLQVSHYSPSLESRDVVLASQLVWNLVIACIFLTWKESIGKTNAHVIKVKVEGHPETLLPRDVSAAESAPKFSSCNDWPSIELPPPERTLFMPAKHPTWPVTRYDSLESRCTRPITALTPDVQSKGRIREVMAVWKAYLSNTLAQYRLFLILMSLAWSRNPDNHIVQCPSNNSQGGPSKSRINNQQQHNARKASKRPIQDACVPDSDRCKRLDIGIEDPNDEPADVGFPCPYYRACPQRHQSCWKKKWHGNDLRKLKEHLYKVHARIVCNVRDCCLAFRKQTEFDVHTHRDNGSRDFIDGFDQSQKDELKNRSTFRLRSPQEYYEEICKILFPDHPTQNVNLDQETISRQDHERILQSRAEAEDDRYRRVHQATIDAVCRNGHATPDLLNSITSIFNDNSPGETLFNVENPHLYHVSDSSRLEDPTYNGGPSSEATNVQRVRPAVEAAVANVRDFNSPYFGYKNAPVDDENGMYGYGGTTVLPQPTTPPQAMSNAALWDQSSGFMRNDFLDVPRNGEQWSSIRSVRDSPASPSGLETQSSRSSVPGLYRSSGTQEPVPQAQTPISVNPEENIPDNFFGAYDPFGGELLMGIEDDKTSVPDARQQEDIADDTSQATTAKPG